MTRRALLRCALSLAGETGLKPDVTFPSSDAKGPDAALASLGTRHRYIPNTAAPVLQSAAERSYSSRMPKQMRLAVYTLATRSSPWMTSQSRNAAPGWPLSSGHRYSVQLRSHYLN